MASGPLLGLGAVQIICGLAVLITDAVSIALYGFSAPGFFGGIIFGIFYMLTGLLTTITGCIAGRPSGSVRCMAITVLVLSILSLLNAFGATIWSILNVMLAESIYQCTLNWSSWIDMVGCYVMWYGAEIYGTQLAFFLLMFIISIAVCVFATRAMANGGRATTTTRVAHVVGQPGVVYAPGPAAYPAGQAAPYPQKV